jgi:hypothetical protein
VKRAPFLDLFEFRGTQSAPCCTSNGEHSNDALILYHSEQDAKAAQDSLAKFHPTAVAFPGERTAVGKQRQSVKLFVEPQHPAVCQLAGLMTDVRDNFVHIDLSPRRQLNPVGHVFR